MARLDCSSRKRNITFKHWYKKRQQKFAPSVNKKKKNEQNRSFFSSLLWKFNVLKMNSTKVLTLLLNKRSWAFKTVLPNAAVNSQRFCHEYTKTIKQTYYITQTFRIQNIPIANIYWNTCKRKSNYYFWNATFLNLQITAVFAKTKLINNKDPFLYLVRRPEFVKRVLIFEDLVATSWKIS